MKHQHAEGLVFFSDLARFSTITDGMDLDELADLLVAYARIADATINGSGGRIIKYISDSVLGIFPGSDVDDAVLALLNFKRSVERDLTVPGRNVRVKVGAHYGPVVMPVLPPFGQEDLFGETVDITVGLGGGGYRSHRDRFIISASTFRKLKPETRKVFHKFTEPIVYLAEE